MNGNAEVAQDDAVGNSVPPDPFLRSAVPPFQLLDELLGGGGLSFYLRLFGELSVLYRSRGCLPAGESAFRALVAEARFLVL